MSISLREVLEGAGYDFDDIDDLRRISNILWDAEDLGAEVDAKIEELEQKEWDEEGREEYEEYQRARRGQY